LDVRGEKEERGIEPEFAVWGKQDIKTANKLRKRTNRLGISYDRIATDDEDSLLSAFGF
jgi:hypothetical protein